MPIKRYDISNEIVIKGYQKYKTIKKTAEALDCSAYLVRSVLIGARRCPHEQSKQFRMLCKLCKVKPVKKGNYLYCKECHRKLTRESAYEEEMVHKIHCDISNI
ncbi:MAG: hypothetical protein ACXADW_14155 [Candidatus Hodarchaeales archaeon]|jgi:hypothetical protein